MGSQDAKQCVSQDAKQCPWCERWCLKDNACAYIFACGLDHKLIFQKGLGCGRSWCWKCGKKFCGQYYHADTGKKSLHAKDQHTSTCCRNEIDFSEDMYCPGGHDSHCVQRW
jgi:hypothetical protein